MYTGVSRCKYRCGLKRRPDGGFDFGSDRRCGFECQCCSAIDTPTVKFICTEGNVAENVNKIVYAGVRMGPTESAVFLLMLM